MLILTIFEGLNALHPQLHIIQLHASYNFMKSLLDHRVVMLILFWNTVASDIVLEKCNHLNILWIFPSLNFTYTIKYMHNTLIFLLLVFVWVIFHSWCYYIKDPFFCERILLTMPFSNDHILLPIIIYMQVYCIEFIQFILSKVYVC